MATVTAIREALADALDTIDDLNTYPRSGADIVVPAAIVYPADPVRTFDVAMDGVDNSRFIVHLLVSEADQQTGQENLDPYMERSGDQSVKAAIEADATLGGVVADAHLISVDGYGVTFEYAGVQYLGCRFNVEVME